MSRHNRDRRRKAAGQLPPANRVPEGLAGRPLFGIDHYQVGSWCPTPDGSGPAEAVALHLHVRLGEDLLELVMRLKTPQAVDTLIAALERHRNDVWPQG